MPRRRIVAVAVGAVLVSGVVVGALAFADEQAREAAAARDVARSRSLAAAAERAESRSPEAALRIALAAYRLVQDRTYTEGYEARDALLSIASRQSRLTDVLRTSLPVVTTVAFSDDGRLLAVASRERTGVKGSIDTWRLGGHPTPAGPRIRTSVNGAGVLRVSEDGGTVIWANTGTLEQFDLASGARHAPKLDITPFIVQNGEKLADDPGSAQLSDDAGVVVVAGTHCVLTAFDTVRRTALPLPCTFSGVLLSPDGHRVVIDEGKGSVVRDLTDGRRVSRVPRFGSIAFGSDSKLLYLGDGKRLVIWDVERGRPARPPLRAPGGAGGGIAVTRDGRYAATVGREGRVRLWSLGRRNPRLPVLPGRGLVFGLTFAADGRTLAIERESGTELIDVDRRARLVNPVPPRPGQTTAIGPDGGTFATGSDDGVVRLWTLARAGAAELPLLTRPRRVARLAGLKAVSFSRTGDRIVVGADDGTVRIVDPVRAATVGPPLLGHEDFVREVAFSPDGKTVAATANLETLRVWNASDGGLLAELPRSGIGHESDGILEVEIQFESVAFTPNGSTLLASDMNGGVRRWDARTLEPRTTIRGVGSPLAVAPDGRTFAAGWLLDGEVQVRTIEGEPIRPTLSTREGIWDIDISRTGRLATAGTDGTISTWDISSGTPGAAIELFDGSQQVDAVAFTPDGSVLVSASYEGASFWDVARGARIGEPQALGANALAVSPDGHTLAVASGSGLELYDLALVTRAGSYELWRARICTVTGGAPMQEELQAFVGGADIPDPCSTA